MKKKDIKGVIFDLDGVLVDTARFHYLAWRKLANQLGFDFSEIENEALKGVSRKASLEYLLKLGGLEKNDEEKSELASLKNDWYISLISNLDESVLLPGVMPLIKALKEEGFALALGSASKNAMPVLESTGLIHYLDYIADGNSTEKSKPDPEVFYIAARGIGLSPGECLVVEDSEKGIAAAVEGGFHSLGIGDQEVLGEADFVLASLENITVSELMEKFTVNNI